jgi:SET domain-containing protein
MSAGRKWDTMALLEKQLVVRRSTLKGAGKGLFTNKPIPRGPKIVEYKGSVSTWKEVDDRNGLNGYIYYVNRHHVIDAWNDKRALARYANDAKGMVRSEGIRNNCKYAIEGVRVYIMALKNIPAGSEILVGYGKEYWDIISENLRAQE